MAQDEEFKSVLAALSPYGSFVSYVKIMNLSSTYGGDPEIRAIEMIFGRHVEIWDVYDQSWRNKMNSRDDGLPPICLAYYQCGDGGHYDVLRKQSSPIVIQYPTIKEITKMKDIVVVRKHIDRYDLYEEKMTMSKMKMALKKFIRHSRVERIKVAIRVINNDINTFNISLTGADSIKKIKKRICTKLNISVVHLYISDGRYLNDKFDLCHYNVVNDKVIYAFIDSTFETMAVNVITKFFSWVGKVLQIQTNATNTVASLKETICQESGIGLESQVIKFLTTNDC